MFVSYIYTQISGYDSTVPTLTSDIHYRTHLWLFLNLSSLFVTICLVITIIEGNKQINFDQAMVLLGFFLRIITFTLTLTQLVDGFQSRMLINNGLALTPQMGFDRLYLFFFISLTRKLLTYLLWFYFLIRWNSWNHFQCNINETLIKQTGNYSL